MTASEGLLRSAIKRSQGDLHAFFCTHLSDETGHLQVLEGDLKQLGVTHIVKFAEAAQLAGAQYYYIVHEHPAMLLGYMAALECSPAPLVLVDQLEAEFGPLKSVRHHAVHDREHGPQLRCQIDSLEKGLRGRVLENEAWTLEEIQSRIALAIRTAARSFST